MKSIGKFLVVVLFLGVVTALCGGVWGFVTLQRALHQPLQLSEPETLVVQPGSSPARVFSELQQQGVLHDAAWLRRYWQ